MLVSHRRVRQEYQSFSGDSSDLFKFSSASRNSCVASCFICDAIPFSLQQQGKKRGSFSRRNAFLKFSLNEFIFFSVERDNPVYVRFSCACFRRFLDKKVFKVKRIATALSHANVDIFARWARHVGTFPGQTRSILRP